MSSDDLVPNNMSKALFFLTSFFFGGGVGVGTEKPKISTKQEYGKYQTTTKETDKVRQTHNETSKQVKEVNKQTRK